MSDQERRRASGLPGSVQSGTFDPRFDAAFQPGYVVEGTFANQGVSEAARQATGTADDAARRSRTASGQSEPAPLDLGIPVLVDAAGTGTAPDDRSGDLRGAASARRRDPVLLALWLISAAFIAGGLVLIGYIRVWLDALNSTGGGTGFDYYLLQVCTIAAPLLILLGLTTTVGTLFVLTARRRPPAAQ